MKFIVSSDVLLKNLQSISGIVGSNIALPIIENFLFHIEKNKLSIVSTDLETTMKVEMDIQSDEKAKICIQAKILLDYLKNLSPQPLTFDVSTDDFGIDITSDQGKYKVVGFNAKEYPKEPVVDNAAHFSIRCSELLTGINSTAFATSTDDMRPAMTGVFFELAKTHLTLVATDAHRLVRYVMADVKCPEKASFIVPRKPLQQLKSILPNDDSSVDVSYNNDFLFIKNEKVSLSCRLIDAKFPDYKGVIPTDSPFLLTLNRQEFLGAVRRVSVFSNKTTNQLVLNITGSELQLYAQDIDFSFEGNERMSCQYQGEDMKIAFNARLLIELIHALHSEDIKIELSTPSRAGIIKPVESNENEDILMLIMPLMTGA